LQRILRWVVGLPIVVLVIAFAIANRRWVTLSFDPFTQEAPRVAMDLPLWLLFFLGIFTGIMVGWIGAWIARTEISKLQVELADMRKPIQENRPQDVVPFNGGFL
jgi:uncharacterized integral membrane protein